MKTHHIDLKHHYFLLEKRRDPVTGEVFQEGNEVVFCARCKSAFLKESWEYLGKKHCNQIFTLKTFPKPLSKLQLKLKESVLYLRKTEKDKGISVIGIVTLIIIASMALFFEVVYHFDINDFGRGFYAVLLFMSFCIYLYGKSLHRKLLIKQGNIILEYGKSIKTVIPIKDIRLIEFGYFTSGISTSNDMYTPSIDPCLIFYYQGKYRRFDMNRADFVNGFNWDLFLQKMKRVPTLAYYTNDEASINIIKKEAPHFNLETDSAFGYYFLPLNEEGVGTLYKRKGQERQQEYLDFSYRL